MNTAPAHAYPQMTEQATRILEQNTRSGDSGRYTVPTDKLYPFQWNWDSCLTALGFAGFDEPRAWEEIRTLFAHQWENGMVPHIVFHQNSDSYFPGPNVWQTGRSPVATSGISQPPVAASCVRLIYEQSQDRKQARAEIRALLPKLFAYHRWYLTERDPDGTGLAETWHPWETGRDNSAEWEEALFRVSTDNLEPYHRRDTDLVDAAQRPPKKEYDHYLALVQLFRENNYDHQTLRPVLPFRIADVGINAILLRANRDLLWLMQVVEQHENEETVQNWVTLQTEAFEKLWCAEKQAYCSYDLIAEKQIDMVTSGSFLPLFAHAVPKDKLPLLLETMDSLTSHADFLVPSLSPEEPDFDRLRYWRGPVWAIVNFMIAKGLESYGEEDRATRIGTDTATLLKSHGFYEYFDPIDGTGLGGDSFTWTAAMWLYWAQHYA
ncbi:MAG: hypothetical protein EP349_08640 [Alphaproteobacteria bacterium]|nr:MAG: hypothetical protein EP349_08640 [Alphaproteobacteria bacterium]